MEGKCGLSEDPPQEEAGTPRDEDRDDDLVAALTAGDGRHDITNDWDALGGCGELRWLGGKVLVP